MIKGSLRVYMENGREFFIPINTLDFDNVKDFFDAMTNGKFITFIDKETVCLNTSHINGIVFKEESTCSSN